jgi:four helix bundle protein
MTNPIRSSAIQGFRDLVVWQKAMQLAVESYRLARILPDDERFLLRAQILSAAVSVPANIAEGRGRLSRADFGRFLSIARGSLLELETLLDVAVRVGYLKDTELTTALGLATEVGKMVRTLVWRLGRKRL